MPDNSHLPLNSSNINRVLWVYFNLFYNVSFGYDIIVFFEAYKMQHCLISPSTAGIHINVAGKIHGIEIRAGGMNFFSTVIREYRLIKE